MRIILSKKDIKRIEKICTDCSPSACKLSNIKKIFKCGYLKQVFFGRM